MAVAWTVTGQAAQGWDTTSRSLEYYAVDSAVLQFVSLGNDELRLSIKPKNIWTATLPSYGQTVALFRNGTRFFTGVVTDLKTRVSGGVHEAIATISGPWARLEKVPVVSTRTSPAGNTGTRHADQLTPAIFMADILEGAVEYILDTYGSGICTANDANFDSSYDGPTITLNQMTATQAIGELMRLVPDAMLWFDYSSATPAAQVSRRGTATVETLTIGTSPIEDIEINPIDGMLVDRVRSPYATRAADGAMSYSITSTASLGNGGADQYWTGSGPELDTFIPPDLLDSIKVWATTATTSTALRYSNKEAREFVAAYGYNPIQTSNNSWTSISYYNGGSASNITTYTNYGNTLPTGYRAWFFGDEGYDPPPDWAIDKYNLIQWEYGKGVWANDISSSGGFNQTRRDKLLKFIPYDVWGTYSIGGVPYTWMTGQWKGPALWISNTSPPADGTTVYKDPDYTFRTPSSTFLTGLRDAQAFVPYEGTITLVEQDVGATRYRGKVINISGALSAYSTMKAMVKSETLDLMAGTTTIELGPPPRNDIRTLVDKVRKTPQDNIIPA